MLQLANKQLRNWLTNMKK